MRRTLSLAGLAFLVAPASAQQVGTPFCFGAACPCGNDDPSAGCGNRGADGDRATGALLVGSGSADVFADDLVLTTSGLAAGQWGVTVMGDAATPTPVGDGLLCVGGGPNGLWRYAPVQADDAGAFALANVVSHSQGFGAQGAIVAGATWSFQSWYRDPGGPCSSGANFSNGLSITFDAAGTSGPVRADLAGRALAPAPWFDFVTSFHQGADLSAAIDPTRMPWLVGVTGDLYVVAARDQAGWDQDATLVDVRGAAQPWTVVAGDLAANRLLVDAGTLPGPAGDAVGIGYDLVFDHDRDGLLGAGDVIDGLGDVAGAYVVRDTVQPGQHGVVEVLYNGGSWLLEDIYYPSDIASLGQVPLIVVSHGNGHDYRWYDHIGYHMASYGFVVMSHSNNTGPGIATASETTLTNTDHFLGNLATIAGGALQGHVDASRIVWIGHSRGGEGVTYAYDRLFDGDFVPVNYTIDDIRLVSSIAPTVFHVKGKSHPHRANYHLWVGSADADVTGGPESPVTQSFTLLERANSAKCAIVLQGAGHGAFHDGGGSLVASGPCLIDRTVVHPMMKGYFLPLVEWFVNGDPASQDFLWRPWDSFGPLGKPSNPCAIVSLEYHLDGADRTVVDDFQSQPDPYVSSAGQQVRWTVRDLYEGPLDDQDNTLNWNVNDEMNGMTRRSYPNDEASGIMFSWDGPGDLEFDVDPEQRNFADDAYLSFRVCQGARHPLTKAALEDVLFDVALIDDAGTTATLPIHAFDHGIVEPYQRGGGWSNEFETVRVHLTDFAANGTGLNLARVRTIRFTFGGAGASPLGRLGLDEVVIERRIGGGN